MSPEHKYSLPQGLRLRQYVIVRLLGHGGFGLTYLADDTSLDRKVAIKELLPIDFAIREKDGTTVVPRSQHDGINFQWARDRFVEEGRTLARLHHASILPIHEIFEEHGTAYIVTAFIEGESMAEWLRQTPHPPEKDLRSIALSLLDALALVHERGYLHRDVKPENILMAQQNRLPILIDFGNARVATGEKTSNLTAVLTKGYAPFEQYQTKGRQGPFTDLYALGAVFYRAITGAPPEDATDRWETDKVAPLCQQMPPGYSREFLATVDKALKMRREDRWQTCAEWRAALSAPERPERPVPWPPVLPALATLAALILACYGIGHWIHGLFSPSPSSNTGNSKSPGIFASATAWLSHVFHPTPTPIGLKWDFTTPRFLFPTPPPHAFALLNTPPPTPLRSPLSSTPRPVAATPAPLPTLSPGFYIPRLSPTPATPPPHRFGSPFSPTPVPSPSLPFFPAWRPALSPTPAPTPAPTISLFGIHLSTSQPFVNSLGMKFVPVEIPGRLATAGRVLFSVWDTRVSDWEAFIQQAGDTVQSGIFAYDSGLGGYDESAMKWGLKPDLSWKRPGFPQTGQHPVVGVDLDDARRFCAWLSNKEGRAYRLPTSAEWSAAVGPQKYPWGDSFPPPKGAGNYGGSESRRVPLGTSLFTIPGYNDGYPRTSPVGSFAANRSGLYDMGGNVAQWCDEAYKVSMNSPQLIATYPFLKEESVKGIPNGVIRGASWSDSGEAYLRSTFCMPCLPATRRSDCGFRCVLVEPPPAKPSFLDLVPSDLKFVPPLLNHPPTPTPSR